MAAKRKIGDLLVAEGAIDEGQLKTALREQERWGRPLGMTLVRLGFVDEDTLIHALASQLKLPVVKLAGKVVVPDVLARVPIDLAEKCRCLPLLENDEGGERVLYLGMEDPADFEAVELVCETIGMKVKPVLVAPSELDAALHRHYHWAQSSTNPSMTTDVDPFGETGPQVDLTEGEAEFIGLSPKPVGAEAAAAAAPVSCGARTDVAQESGRTPAPPVSGATSTQGAGVPTESLLRALTQLLVEKGVITRDELVERVQLALRQSGGDGEG